MHLLDGGEILDPVRIEYVCDQLLQLPEQSPDRVWIERPVCAGTVEFQLIVPQLVTSPASRTLETKVPLAEPSV